jgi:2-amino-4-hydroxy-6-hydroxymethyldihydropteridine diphosphokinase
LPTSGARFTANADPRPVSAATVAYVALGANLDDPTLALTAAVAAIARLGPVTARSHLYLTAPVGGPAGQPPYRNAVVAWRPAPPWATPAAALAALLAIERALGRQRRERWGPRRIDLDLLDLITPAPAAAPPFAPPETLLPHPRAHERAFVLLPWADVAPDHRLGPSGCSVAALASAIDRSGVALALASDAARWRG